MSSRAALVAVALTCACQQGVSSEPVDTPAPPVDAPPEPAVVVDAPGAPSVPVVDGPVEWLRGSTHVHTRGSGDCETPVETVTAWYAAHDYDFIVITDHNVVTPAAANDLIVIPGVELTHNPNLCLPRRHPTGKCRVHVNLLGVTAPPIGRFDWANYGTRDREVMYDAALAQQRRLGGLAQLNHPTNYFGMTGELLATLAEHGYGLVEIWNQAFRGWDRSRRHPSSEALWDEALVRGARLFGVAVDDAHHYRPGGKYLAGGAWITVHARRDPAAILAAIAAGDFYASTGVELTRIEVVDGELVVESPTEVTFDFIENGERVATVTGTSAHHTLPAQGYVRADVHGAADTRAWVQPHWRW